MAEKGCKVETRQVDLRNKEQFLPAFRAINPEVTVPVLQLADGSRLTDIVGICRYLDELTPEPPLFGDTPLGKATVESWQRWCDREGFYAVMDGFRNSTPGLRGRALPGPVDYEQIPALAARSRDRILHFFRRLDERLDEAHFVGGSAFSIADITAVVAVDFASWIKLRPPSRLRHLQRWQEEVSRRPSWAA